MKLLNLDHSPYATRVRIQIRHKNLPVSVAAPEVPLRTPEFLSRYPLGKIPVLELDDGRTIGESVAILRYLEACFPEPALVPADAAEAAFDGMLTGFADAHLAPALFPLFGSMLGRGEVDTAAQVADIEAQLKKLEHLLAEWQPGGARLTLGSICAATVIAYTVEICGHFERPTLFAELPQVAAWWEGLQGIPVLAETLEEMLVAQRLFLQKFA